MAALAIILTQSRTIWFALGISGILLFFRHRKQISHSILFLGFKKILLFSAIIIVGLSYVLVPRILLISNIYAEGGQFPTRIEMINEGIEAFLQSPWIGYGIGTNEYILHSLFPDGVMSYFPAAVHMGFLQLMLEIGIFGFSAFIYPIWYIGQSLLSECITFGFSNRAISFSWEYSHLVHITVSILMLVSLNFPISG